MPGAPSPTIERADRPLKSRVVLAATKLSARCYVDLNDDYRNSVLLSSSGRSGSTWLADIINYKNDYRLIFEPFRHDRVPLAMDIRYGHYIDPGDRSTDLREPIEAILRGNVRTWWTDRYNQRRFARRRLIKDIRSTNLIPWIRSNFPALPIVYLLRHPWHVATSWNRLGWDDFLADFLVQERLRAELQTFDSVIRRIADAEDPFERLALRWCLENYLPLKLLKRGDVHVVFYEDLLAEPRQEIGRLFEYLGKEDGDGRVMKVVAARSRTTFPARAADAPTELRLQEASEIVATFGLDRVYGQEPRPRVRPDELLAPEDGRV